MWYASFMLLNWRFRESVVVVLGGCIAFLFGALAAVLFIVGLLCGLWVAWDA